MFGNRLSEDVGLRVRMEDMTPQDQEECAREEESDDDEHRGLGDPEQTRQKRGCQRRCGVLDHAYGGVTTDLLAYRESELIYMPEDEMALQVEMQRDRQHVGNRDHNLDLHAHKAVEDQRRPQVHPAHGRAGDSVSNRRTREGMPEQRADPLHANIVTVLDHAPPTATPAPETGRRRSAANAPPGFGNKDIRLLLPEDDVADPELSIVVPALNEELTITDFVAWCRQGLDDAGVSGEILIVDSSTDRTPELARAAGARVLQVPKRGLGRAYMDAIPLIRGSWVLMGDADCTYDFRLLGPFVERFHEGNEYVMGSRWKGSIEPGSMPWLHQHFGTPITTWILNRLFSSQFSDIHCGMRGITRDALVRMDLQSESWEYASEMVLKSVQMELRTTEVPVRFLADRDGRLSHHKRAGWFSPWQAAWINLRAMFIYGSDFFVFKPGIVLTLLGFIVLVATTFGNLKLGAVTLSLNWQFLALAVFVVGLQALFLGGIAHVLFDFTGRRTRQWLRVFPYTRTVLISALLFVAGIALAVPLAVAYLSNHLILTSANFVQDHLAVTGLAAAIAGAQLFAFVLLLHGAAVATHRRRPRVSD